jgi:uncharacterized protein (TIGR02118 family)
MRNRASDHQLEGILFKVEVSYREPSDKAVFEERYFETHVPLVQRIPGLQGFEVSDGEVLADDGTYLIATLSFADQQTADEALAGEEAGASMENLNSFADGLYSIRSYQTKSLL